MLSANPQIERLMLAMSRHEGWLSPAETATPGGSRAYRNHNPGNLRSSIFQAGQHDGFAYFRSDFIGWMAFHWDLMAKARGQTRTSLNSKSTLRDLIHVWAPTSDGNVPEAYLASVVRDTGIPADRTLGEIFGL
jgi:hypothetical protein